MKYVLPVCLVGLTACLCALLLTVRATVAQVPVEIRATRAALIAETDKQAAALLKLTDAKLEHALRRVDIATADLNKLATGAVQRADIQTDKALQQIAGIRQDLKPTLDALPPVMQAAQAAVTEAQATIHDAQATLDDAYPDLRGLLESSTVAATQIAQTADTVRGAAPQFLSTAQETNRQFAGIATDVHKFTTKFTAPASFRAKVWEGFKSLALIGSHF